MQYYLKPISSNVFSGQVKYNNTFTRLGPAISAVTGEVFTGLTVEDEQELEDLLRMAPGTLSPKSPFWDDFHVPIGKGGLALDTEENDEHALWVKFLKADKLVALGVDGIKAKPNAEYVLSSENEDAKVSNENRKYKKQAYTILSGLTPAGMRDILTLLGKPSQSTSDDVVENQLGLEMEADYKKYVSIAGDEKLKWKVLINNAVSYGVIRREGRNVHGEYFFQEVFLGKGVDAVVEFLTAKSNVAVYTGIKKELADLLNVKG